MAENEGSRWVKYVSYCFTIDRVFPGLLFMLGVANGLFVSVVLGSRSEISIPLGFGITGGALLAMIIIGPYHS